MPYCSVTLSLSVQQYLPRVSFGLGFVPHQWLGMASEGSKKGGLEGLGLSFVLTAQYACLIWVKGWDSVSIMFWLDLGCTGAH